MSTRAHGLTPQRPHAELLAVRATGSEAYLQGALRDGTRSARHKTHRFGQKERGWLVILKDILEALGQRGWIYREGRDREFWVLETTAPFLDIAYDASPLIGSLDGLDYVRGYFDAEGGMPRDPSVRLYFQYCQKDRRNLEIVRSILQSWDVTCGRVHNPSKQVDPDYWRFYIRAESHERFMRLVSSWHPRKHEQMRVRLARLAPG